jgi:peroxiredoxin
MALKVGDKAPPFKLPHKPREETDVGQHFGKEKVVLLFFPLAFSGVCTAEMCAFRDNWSQWQVPRGRKDSLPAPVGL